MLKRIYVLIYLLKSKELILLRLHESSGDVVAPKALPELDPVESVTVLCRVGLPPVESGASQLPCCVKDSFAIVALNDLQLTLHCTELVVGLDRVSRMRKRRWVALQEVRAHVADLLRWWRWRLCVSLLQCLNRSGQGRHHLHLELEELLRSQGRRRSNTFY